MNSKDKSNINKYDLYQKSVQNVKIEVEFFRKCFRMIYNKVATSFREDFCGTGLLSCEWVKNNVMNSAVGLDIDPEALAWGIENNVNNLNSGSNRIQLINHNVLDPYNEKEKFEIICSLNYSHFLLTKRKEILTYFNNVYKSLDSKGIFILDFYGGSHIYEDHKYQQEKSQHFYQFSGKQMNILNNQSKCSLNFKINKNKFTPHFTFNFRIYSILEMRDTLEEVGFKKFKLHIKEINEEDEDDYVEYEEVDIDGEYFPESSRITGYLIAYN